MMHGQQNVKQVLMYSTLYSCLILFKFEHSRQEFLKNTRMPNFMKIRPVGGELFDADEWTDGWT